MVPASGIFPRAQSTAIDKTLNTCSLAHLYEVFWYGLSRRLRLFSQRLCPKMYHSFHVFHRFFQGLFIKYIAIRYFYSKFFKFFNIRGFSGKASCLNSFRKPAFLSGGFPQILFRQ
jgi:hypothetical protein